MTQTAIPCSLMRGGTSRGPFFASTDLPTDIATRDRVLVALMGSPDLRQTDGVGGGHPLTSKVGVVGPSRTFGVDLDFLFAQLQPNTDRVDTTPNCGNMLAAVVPFALERGMVSAQGDETTVRVLTLNTGMQCDITVQTPRTHIESSTREVEYVGETRIDGVLGTASPIKITFLETAGSVCASLLPTGNLRDTITLDDGGVLDVTCIDNGMPMVLIAATQLDRTGCESVEQMNSDSALKLRLEALRLRCGGLMGLGDVKDKNFPKMCLVAPPASSGTINTRCFIPHVCHDSIGVLAAVTVATACVLEGTVASEVARNDAGDSRTVSVEHPAGEFSVLLTLDPSDGQTVLGAALLRTARTLMRGEVFVPRTVWSGPTAASQP